MQKFIMTTKKTLVHSLAVLLLVPAFSTISAYANTDQHSGTINFSGAVVHSPCTNHVQDSKITLSCLNDNADATINHIDLNKVQHVQGWKVINDGRNEYSYNWVNEEKQLGMLTVKYI